jgi:hypothetical protein
MTYPDLDPNGNRNPFFEITIKIRMGSQKTPPKKDPCVAAEKSFKSQVVLPGLGTK